MIINNLFLLVMNHMVLNYTYEPFPAILSSPFAPVRPIIDNGIYSVQPFVLSSIAHILPRKVTVLSFLCHP